MKWIVITLIISTNLCAKISAVQKYREAIGDNVDKPSSKYFAHYETFLNSINTEIGNSNFSAYEFLGYSGAGYEDIEKFKLEFAKRVINAYEQSKKLGGAKAKTVFILGGSVDGFGEGYKVIDELRKTGKIKDVIVTGMISDQIVDYHIEGLEKGWGDVVSPHNDKLLLMETFKDKKDVSSWELKTNKDDISKTVRLLTDLGEKENAHRVQMEIFEGGKQAFKEGLEFTLETKGKAQKYGLNLNVNYAPKKATKDTGYRAATFMTYTPQELHHKSINVTITNGQTLDQYNYNQFYNSDYGLRVRMDNLNPIANVEAASMKIKELETQLKRDPSNEVLQKTLEEKRAEKRYFETILNIKSETSDVVSGYIGREKLAGNLSQAQEYINKIPAPYRKQKGMLCDLEMVLSQLLK